MKQSRRRGLNPVSKSWMVAAFMRGRTRAWMPTSGYELRERVEIDGKPWTFCFKLHVVSELDDKLEDWAGIRLRATVTIWPPKLSDGDEKKLARLGVYRAAKKTLALHGYAGDWETIPGLKKYGTFEKELASVVDLRREAKLLEKLSLSPEALLNGNSPP
jgi:hypothetical protein